MHTHTHTHTHAHTHTPHTHTHTHTHTTCGHTAPLRAVKLDAVLAMNYRRTTDHQN